MVKKAIIPVAGWASRFLPATKAQPKTMLPLIDKPIIQYIVEEAVASGIEEIIFITGADKRAIEDHFDTNFGLEYRLEQDGKTEELRQVREVAGLAKFAYVRQKQLLGDGDAVRQAAHLIGDSPCAVMFCDDVVLSKKPCLKQLIEVYEKYGDPVVGLDEMPEDRISQFGVIGGKEIEKDIYQIDQVIEKPSIKEAPSNLAILGRYILTPEIFQILLDPKTEYSGEVRIADALRHYSKEKPIYGVNFEGRWLDCGKKIGFLKASVELALQRPDISKEFSKFLKEKCKEL